MGPPHDFPDRPRRDQEQTDCMEDAGYNVLRFHRRDDWAATFAA